MLARVRSATGIVKPGLIEDAIGLGTLTAVSM
jgi:hypothetical protein